MAYADWTPRALRFHLVACAAGAAVACAPVARPAAPLPAAGVAFTQRVDVVDRTAREPMVVEHASGALFVAGYGRSWQTLWKSVDRGATWRRVDVGMGADGSMGNSDVDLAVARDGTLYFASMTFDRDTGEGRQIAIGASTDEGATWRWTTLSKARFCDRPWVEVAADGAAHVVWNDGSGVAHSVSRDRGITWSPSDRVHDHGGSSHLAIGPAGEIAVRITPSSASGNRFDPGVDLIAVSTDGGASWQKRPAPGERDWSADLDAPGVTPRWVEPLAWDHDGRLYSLWADKTSVRLARSKDRGASWTTWLIASAPAQPFFPYLIARGRGTLAATWFSASRADFADLRWHFARLDVGAGDGQPRVVQSEPQTLESARPRPGQADAVYNDPGGEYLAIAPLRDGSFGVVTPIQNEAGKRMGFTWWQIR